MIIAYCLIGAKQGVLGCKVFFNAKAQRPERTQRAYSVGTHNGAPPCEGIRLGFGVAMIQSRLYHASWGDECLWWVDLKCCFLLLYRHKSHQAGPWFGLIIAYCLIGAKQGVLGCKVFFNAKAQRPERTQRAYSVGTHNGAPPCEGIRFGFGVAMIQSRM
ncbi:MAG: hypothetical protein C0184_13805 [Chloroflexus aggregans]|uniref:Uncharacterized protein n=1 Tax=Chloroflexus aggregans TaxID=152260 RepID=A0A2J6WWV7_9CHLR|nr:MAG: hypothetical protein C0184_13805 [Chloroflexus aggregans]